MSGLKSVTPELRQVTMRILNLDKPGAVQSQGRMITAGGVRGSWGEERGERREGEGKEVGEGVYIF